MMAIAKDNLKRLSLGHALLLLGSVLWMVVLGYLFAGPIGILYGLAAFFLVAAVFAILFFFSIRSIERDLGLP